MFRGVHPESLDTDRDEVVDVIGYLLPDIVGAAIEIIEADEVAVPDLLGVVVVVYLAVWLMEVVIPEGHGRVGLSTRGRRFILKVVCNQSLFTNQQAGHFSVRMAYNIFCPNLKRNGQF